MKKTVSLLLSLALCAGFAPALAAESFPAVNAYPGFADVPAGSWYFENAKLCYEVGLMTGTDRGFAPDQVMTVAETIVLAARINETLFNDPIPALEEGDVWYRNSLTYLEERGIVTLEEPEAQASRETFLSMLSLVLPDSQLSPINAITALPDTQDADVLRFYNAGILTGIDAAGTFQGDKTLTRAECAAMLSRIVRPELRQSFTPTQSGTVADPVELLLGVSRDTPLLTVDGQSVPAQEYLYFLNYQINQLANALFDGDPTQIDWTLDMQGETLGDMLKDEALQTAVLYRVVETEAAKAGTALTADQEIERNASVDSTKIALGGDAAFQTALNGMFLDEEGYRHILTVADLYDNLKTKLFSNPTQADLDAYVEANGILRAKHILVSDKAQADEILAQIRAAQDPAAKFDELMNAYSEDGRMDNGELAAPDGYTFGPDEMVASFEEGTKALKVGEISAPIQSDYGYHIILRLAPEAGELRADWTEAAMNDWISEKILAAKVETTPLYNTLNPELVMLTSQTVTG